MIGIRYTLKVLTAALLLSACNKEASEISQSEDAWPASFGLGRTALSSKIDSLNIDVSPDGTGLPNGTGTVLLGQNVYVSKCAVCHGATGVEGPYNKLVAVYHENESSKAGEKAIGNYWPYATTLYDYVNRAMPYNAPGTLTADEVYSLTAFLLYKNEIIDSTLVLDKNNLASIVMPARKLFVPDDRKGGAEIR